MFNIRKLKILFVIIMSMALIITGCSQDDKLSKYKKNDDTKIVSYEVYNFI